MPAAAGKRSGRVRSLTVAARKLPEAAARTYTKYVSRDTGGCEPRASASDAQSLRKSLPQPQQAVVGWRMFSLLPGCEGIRSTPAGTPRTLTRKPHHTSCRITCRTISTPGRRKLSASSGLPPWRYH